MTLRERCERILELIDGTLAPVADVTAARRSVPVPVELHGRTPHVVREEE